MEGVNDASGEGVCGVEVCDWDGAGDGAVGDCNGADATEGGGEGCAEGSR